MGLAIVLVLRLVLPLTVLRWRLAGALITITADAADVIIFQATDFPGMGYHAADKLLDAYSMSLFAIATHSWENTERRVALGLFAYRLVGVIAFELTGSRILLFLFPNVFEFFFVFNAARLRYAPAYEMTLTRCLGWVAVLLVPKLVQEYALHYAQWLDQWSALEIIRSIWRRLLPG